MAYTGVYQAITTAGPTTTEAMLVQAQSRVLVGTEGYDTALNAAAANGARIGMASGKSYDLGVLASLGLESTSELEQFEAANVASSGIFTLTNEEVVLSVGVTEFNYQTLQLAMSNSVMYEEGTTEVVYTVGGSCSTVSRPIVVETENIGCQAPAAGSEGDVTSGVAAIVITIYDAQSTSGLPWSDIVAGEINTLELEFTAKSITEHAAGNKLMSVYIF